MTEPRGDVRLGRARAAIDAVNADDPDLIDDRGVRRPRAVVEAERVSAWLDRLDPDADDLQRLAARGHHLGRWSLPRADYPPGRQGYLRWRAVQRTRQMEAIGNVLAEAGYDRDEVDRVKAIVGKQGLGRDAVVQTHEDALCLVFLEQQLDGVADQLGDDHTVDVLRRTIAKMSPAAVEAAATLGLSDAGRRLLTRAFEPVDATEGH